MAPRSGLAERERAQVAAARGGAPDLVGSVRLEDGRAAVVHAHHHRGRCAVAGEALDDCGGAAEAEAETAHLGRAHGAEQAGIGQRFQRSFGKGSLLVHAGSVGGHRLGADCFEHGGIIGGIRTHASPRGRRPRQSIACEPRAAASIGARNLRAGSQLKTGGSYACLQSITNGVRASGGSACCRAGAPPRDAGVKSAVIVLAVMESDTCLVVVTVFKIVAPTLCVGG
jgi:hypothetical protein